jgi:hypothetical protein
VFKLAQNMDAPAILRREFHHLNLYALIVLLLLCLARFSAVSG